MKKKLILITAIILGTNTNVKSQCQEDKTIITSPVNPLNDKLLNKI